MESANVIYPPESLFLSYTIPNQPGKVKFEYISIHSLVYAYSAINKPWPKIFDISFIRTKRGQNPSSSLSIPPVKVNLRYIQYGHTPAKYKCIPTPTPFLALGVTPPPTSHYLLKKECTHGVFIPFLIHFSLSFFSISFLQYTYFLLSRVIRNLYIFMDFSVGSGAWPLWDNNFLVLWIFSYKLVAIHNKLFIIELCF